MLYFPLNWKWSCIKSRMVINIPQDWEMLGIILSFKFLTHFYCNILPCTSTTEGQVLSTLHVMSAMHIGFAIFYLKISSWMTHLLVFQITLSTRFYCWQKHQKTWYFRPWINCDICIQIQHIYKNKPKNVAQKCNVRGNRFLTC